MGGGGGAGRGRQLEFCSPEPSGSKGAISLAFIVVVVVVIVNNVQTSPLKPLGQSNAKFYVEPSREGVTKCHINVPGHLIKMADIPIYDKKTFKNLLLQNEKSYDLETWHVASVSQVLQVYIMMILR